MSQLFTTGKVISNLELKASAKQNLYIHFTLVEQIGYGEQMHSQFIHVWAWGYQAEQLKRLGVRKGSIIWVSGALELEEFVNRDGSTRDKQLKLKLTDWGFTHGHGCRASFFVFYQNNERWQSNEKDISPLE